MGEPARIVQNQDDPSANESLLLSGIPAGILILDEAGRVLLASPVMSELLGGRIRSLDEAGGASGDFPRTEILLALKAAGAAGVGMSQLFTRDRERRHTYFVSAVPRRTDHGEKRLVAMVMDLTRVADRSDMTAEFVRQMRHDLRGPLTSLKGAVDLLKTERMGRLEPGQHRLLDLIEKSTSAMTDLLTGKSERSGDEGGPPAAGNSDPSGGGAEPERGSGACPGKS
jgi:two-component system, NtrC family, sensor histidine kinase KinB